MCLEGYWPDGKDDQEFQEGYVFVDVSNSLLEEKKQWPNGVNVS